MFNLTEPEKQSALWLKIEADLRKYLNEQHIENSKTLDIVRTSFVRGRISMINRILSAAVATDSGTNNQQGYL